MLFLHENESFGLPQEVPITRPLLNLKRIRQKNVECIYSLVVVGLGVVLRFDTATRRTDSVNIGLICVT